jgi:hypothetical protein
MTPEEFEIVVRRMAKKRWDGEIPPTLILQIMWDMFNHMSMEEFEDKLIKDDLYIQSLTPQERIRKEMEQAKRIAHHYMMAESAENN